MLILVVDDDDDTREAIRDALRAEHFDVMDAARGERALELLRAGLLPDAILLDMKMPNMSGADFRARQLAIPRLASIPIIVISALADAEVDWAGQTPAVLRKPFLLEDLVAAVDGVTRKQSGFHQRPGRGDRLRKVREG